MRDKCYARVGLRVNLIEEVVQLLQRRFHVIDCKRALGCTSAANIITTTTTTSTTANTTTTTAAAAAAGCSRYAVDTIEPNVVLR